MEFIESQKVMDLIGSYPPKASKRLIELRALIVKTANETEGVAKLLETTKWNEPSYVTNSGSTIRMDWKTKTPDNFYLFFICSTELVATFKLMFGDELQFDGNRAIVFNLNEPIAHQAIGQCLSLAMRYHKVKHLPMLGV